MLYLKLINCEKSGKKRNRISLNVFIKIKIFLLCILFVLLKNEDNVCQISERLPGEDVCPMRFSPVGGNEKDDDMKISTLKRKQGENINFSDEACANISVTHDDISRLNVFEDAYNLFCGANFVNEKYLVLFGCSDKRLTYRKRGHTSRILRERVRRNAYYENGRENTEFSVDSRGENEGENEGDDEENRNQLPSASNEVSEGMIFFCFIFISATMLQFILSKINRLNIPVSVIWFLYGMCTYVIAKNFNMFEENALHKSIINARNIDSSVLYFVLLPILLYEATQDINYYAFKNFLYGGIGLAVIGVALQVGILGIMFYYSFMYRQEQSPLSSSFLLASILSSTDPVAVLSILSVVDAPSKISSMFHVESLINDGSSVLLFQFFFYLTIGYKANASQYVILFVKLLFLSPVFGIGMAMLTFAWINLYRKYYYNQCLATITMCYLSYFVSEYYFNLSGPLAIVCYGLFINAYGHIALDEVAQRKHKEIVELLALMGNSSIFIISGIVSFGMMENVFKDNLYFFMYIVLTYIYLVLARSIMIVIFTPFLSRIGYPINWKEILLLIWGGLRGGIVLVLGLRIEAENKINDKLTKELAYYISGSVLLILTIQGLTFECLYKMLNIYPPNPFRIVYLEKVLKMIDYNFYIRKKNLKNYWLFKGTNILHFSNKIVPELYWRKMNKYGEFDLRLPDIYACLQDISSCDISFWERAYDSQTVIESFDDISSYGQSSFPNKKENRINPGGEKKSDNKNSGHSSITRRILQKNEFSSVLKNDTLNDGGTPNGRSVEIYAGRENPSSGKMRKSIYEEVKWKNSNFTDIEYEDNSDEYSYINNEDSNSRKKRIREKIRMKNNGSRRQRVGEFMSRGKRSLDNFSQKGEMKINIIRNNDNYFSSNDEDEHNYTNINYSLSSKNLDKLSNHLNELSDNESCYTDKVCENSKIKNLNAFNYAKISIKTYDRLINKMNYREFKRTKTEKENFTVIDSIVDNKNEEAFNPKYNLRLIEHATDLPKTLSDNLLVRSSVENEKGSNGDLKNGAQDYSEKEKKKKKNFNILHEQGSLKEGNWGKEIDSMKESVMGRNPEGEKQYVQNDIRPGEEHLIKNINYENITKMDENLLNNYKDLKRIVEGTNEDTPGVTKADQGENELLMSDNFIIKIQKEKSHECEEDEEKDFVKDERGEGHENDLEEKDDEAEEEEGDIKNCITCVTNEEGNVVDDIINYDGSESKNNEHNFEEYLTYKNLFAMDSDGKRISSFFNKNYDKKSSLKMEMKNSSELNISTKGTNSKTLMLMNNEIEKRKRMKNMNKSKCASCTGMFDFTISPRTRRDSNPSALKVNGNKGGKRKKGDIQNCADGESEDFLNGGSQNGRISRINSSRKGGNDNSVSNNNNSNGDFLDGGKGIPKVQRNNTADFTAKRYDTDRTINFECIEDVCQKKHVATFYSFLKRPKMKIKNKLFSEIRRARSHESYGKSQDKSRKSKDDVFYSSLKKKIVRKEREGELYIMIFNTCRELYKKLYVNGFISGECLLTLTSILDLSADFALKKVRMNPIKAWADAFDKGKNKNSNKRRRSIDHRNGFEYEFNVLLSKLKINTKHSFFFSPKVVNIFLVYEHCMKDLQIILSYVDVHQCTLDKGGITMKLLLGKNLLRSYYRNIELAKSLIPHLVNKYKDVVKYCLIKIGADMLMHLKKTIVNEQAANGLLLTQDNEKLNGIFDEQQIKINRYRPYLHYFLKKNMFKMIIK
ncbi:sodium/hydrogen exchanger, putative [Plasmodium knowlesi strain H]|uniref:Sodium/hydrogen exchanger, putative n=3 Tax=Plasmodium knowlesi TaxID=5850 RepID=A0A5K1VFJ1_PLAKH|nr:sodium/hydrogen exchanger, putative [Plasmodium knowlesi strain H]OTN64194.1 putative Sodium/hydrogen exchanger [Plasmodium knowlesi]CAA9990636.1 sodium/hydrogen exchanger, putative [Plasmodium knowlesi strain H]SBO26014.1 sodium/hydrogen exchanger, putative [Plasmodium knowlesi strain H]SBO28722.1 sodium/hydrogen exchanger, putative [Plasmodium knowlesi strain H]VVS80110.1 sodium/hydrogen exchanger, putative [Plasmodium knowlesi strain H]|eukprot:XP_002261927.1 sodium/hydrogen exchanger, putative [Plasmodium knowlesi strain H]